MIRLHLRSSLWLFASLLTVACPAAEDVPYSVGSWPEALGNHRARIQAMEKADAVWIHLPWRRHNRDIEKQNILIVDAATGKTVENVARVRIERESADLVFQPATAPGEYFVYYAPYEIQPGSGGYAGDYLPPQAAAAPAWLKGHGLTAEEIAAADAGKFPQAKVLAFQARSEFERSDPMEVVATWEEMQKFLADYPTPYLVFAEDRGHPIRMDDVLPLRWIRSGPVHELRGQAERNEYYAFQIGVYAAGQPLAGIDLEFTDLASPQGGVIPAARLSCINLSGNDYLGHPIRHTVAVPQGKVQALWCGIDVPRDAAPGEYEGVATVRAKDAEPTPVRLRLSIAERVREDRGDNEPRDTPASAGSIRRWGLATSWWPRTRRWRSRGRQSVAWGARWSLPRPACRRRSAAGAGKRGQSPESKGDSPLFPAASCWPRRSASLSRRPTAAGRLPAASRSSSSRPPAGSSGSRKARPARWRSNAGRTWSLTAAWASR